MLFRLRVYTGREQNANDLSFGQQVEGRPMMLQIWERRNKNIRIERSNLSKRCRFSSKIVNLQQEKRAVRSAFALQ